MVKFAFDLKPSAVIFDFDGVIVDTEPLHYKAFQRILAPKGLAFTWQEYVDTYMGFDDRDAFIEAHAACGFSLSQDELRSLVSMKAGIFQEIIKEGVNSYPGVVDLIKTLSAGCMPLAICSGALRSDIIPIIASLGISECFSTFVTADDVTKSKPDPESYLRSYNNLNTLFPNLLSKRKTIAIEDTPAGITAALQAGLQVVAVTNSYSRSELFGASIIVDSLAELLAM